MQTIWNEETIRKEFTRLDKKTKLHGADLPIKFGNAKTVLGRFYGNTETSMAFYFSKYYFDNPDFPYEEAVDTIRHEYAHYMDYELYGNHGHGATWKKCCNVVGAYPIRCYSEERADFFRERHKKEAEEVKAKEKAANDLPLGTEIKHPVFGAGTVIAVADEKGNLFVEFEKHGMKKLSALWIRKNCG